MPRQVLTESMKEIIKINRLKMPAVEIGLLIGCDKGVVQRFLRKNGLTPPRELSRKWVSEKLKGKTIMTPEQDEILKREYLLIPVKTLASLIGVSDTCLKTRMDNLGLEIPRSIIEQRKRDSRIKPGNVPANKGKKMEEFCTPETILKFKKNSYEKGHMPHNHIPGGDVVTIRKDSNGNYYKWYKIKEGKWEMLHRYNWKKAHGPIPKGMLVTFKNGDQMDCSVENLELITRNQNARRNQSKFLALPEEVKTSINLINKIKNEL